ncbi:MAG: hypothetical protein V1858_04500 [Candidatus Gottesmanbacteria bacterium]
MPYIESEHIEIRVSALARCKHTPICDQTHEMCGGMIIPQQDPSCDFPDDGLTIAMSQLAPRSRLSEIEEEMKESLINMIRARSLRSEGLDPKSLITGKKLKCDGRPYSLESRKVQVFPNGKY